MRLWMTPVQSGSDMAGLGHLWSLRVTASSAAA